MISRCGNAIIVKFYGILSCYAVYLVRTISLLYVLLIVRRSVVLVMLLGVRCT